MQEIKEILKQVKKIEIRTKKLVEGLITGNYHSVFKGQGIEFSEIRDYRPGDDIRAIDWKVTARFNHPYIKEFIEERDLQVYFAFDVSGSNYFGSDISKKRKAIELIASLMFSALRNNDNVGLFLFTDKIEKFIPAKEGKKHVLKLIRELVSFKPKSKKTDLKESLSYISKILKKSSVVFIVSDFYSDGFFKHLKVLKNRHDVIGIRIQDKREFKIPNIGLIELEDGETGEQILLDTSDREFQRKYQEIVKEKNEDVKKQFKKMKIDLLDLKTDEPYSVPLKKFFKIRQHRMVR